MLSTALGLFKKFNKSDIKYCHWKSNEHLKEGLSGTTDLDVLVDRQDRMKCENILNNMGYKRFDTPRFVGHPGTEDYIGMDESSGDLIHIHLHYRLVLGKNLKQYHIPWESQILNNRVQDEDTGVYRADPHFEIVLFWIRISIKKRFTSFLSMNKRTLSKSMYKELEWLKNIVNEDKLRSLIQKLLGQRYVELIKSLNARSSSVDLLNLKFKVAKDFKLYRTYPPGLELPIRYARIGKSVASQVCDTLGLPYLLRRTAPNGGLVVAVIGADGSGKSTVTKDLSKCLSWKLNSKRYYLGSRSGESRSIIKKALGTFASKATKSGNSDNVEKNMDSNQNENKKSKLHSLLSLSWKVLYSTADSYDKNRKLKALWRERNKGGIIITDRYPQNRYPGVNDGPNLHGLNNNTFLRYISRYEKTPYEYSEKRHPDIVVKLLVDANVAQSRDPEMKLEKRREKCRIVENLRFDDSITIEVNANKSKEEVIRKVKKEVWECI